MPLFESMTPEVILERILSRMDTDLQTREGSYAYDQAAPISFEIWRVLMTLDELIEAFYVNENSGPYLDAHARLFAMSRREGAKAAAKMTFFGRDGTVVPAGSLFYAAGALEFRLTADVAIRDGTGTGYVLASEVGSAYNVSAGTIGQIGRTVAGLEKFENEAAEGGADMRELMSCLPENYPASKETVTFQEAIQPEVGALWEARDDLLAQLDPWTAEWGLDYWEDALGLANGQGVDLDIRRRVIVAKLQGRATTTPEVVKHVAETLLGVSVKVIEIFGEYRVELEVVPGLVPGAELARLKDQLRQIMPAHLDWAVVIPVLARISLTPRAGPRCSEVTLEQYRPEPPGIPVGMTSWLGCVASVSTVPMAAGPVAAPNGQ